MTDQDIASPAIDPSIPSPKVDIKKVDLRSDWDNREMVEVVQLNILKIVEFLNQFDRSVRYRLSRLHEKVTNLERSLQHCEAAVRSSSKTVDDEEYQGGEDV